MHKRVMALLLSLVLLLSAAMPVPAMAAEEEYAGSFVFVAMNANSTIVEPTRIQYKSGQTIQQALADSDIEFVGLEQGFIYEINGVSANYLLYYDKGGYKLDAPASSIKALCVHVSSTYSDEAFQLILQMADYLDMTNHVQNYPAAANAYAAALKGLRTATADSAGILPFWTGPNTPSPPQRPKTAARWRLRSSPLQMSMAMLPPAPAASRSSPVTISSVCPTADITAQRER